jgi:uncharacterized damage-inducible protein DinB
VTDLLAALKTERRLAHQRLLALVADLSEDQLRWRPGSHAPAIGFHLFHVARWAERDRQMIGGGAQVWETEGLATAWGLVGIDLGPVGTAMGIGDEASERLVLPGRAVLVAYAEDAFAAIDDYVDGLTLADLQRKTEAPDTADRVVQDVLLSHLAHDNRHLGMIEALRGLIGLKGSATA